MPVSWPSESTQTITWDVSNTDQAPVNCSNVDIYLSKDAGRNFDTLLADNIANDGIENIIRGWCEVNPWGGVGGYPLTVFIDSNMEIYKIHSGSTGMSFVTINEIIEEMLDN